MAIDIMTAMKETQLIWEELSKDAHLSKYEAAALAGLPHAAGYPHACPCCEFAGISPYTIEPFAMPRTDCNNCPIWGKCTENCDTGLPTDERAGRYRRWRLTTGEGRLCHAAEIARYAKEDYDLLYSIEIGRAHV